MGVRFSPTPPNSCPARTQRWAANAANSSSATVALVSTKLERYAGSSVSPSTSAS